MDHKIKILFTGLDNANHVGGIETYIYEILHHIDLRIFQIDFLVFNNSNPFCFEKFKSLGCKFHFVTSRYTNPIRNFFEIKRLMESETFNLIHCHQNTLSYIAPAIIANRLGIPVILHSHNSSMACGLRSKVLHFINKHRIPRNNVKFLAVSDYAGRWMFGSKFFTILNNGVDERRFSFSLDARKKIRKEKKINDSQRVFIHVGAFRKQKNHLFLIKVFAEYTKVDHNSVLMLVGCGSLENEMKAFVGQLGLDKKILFCGSVNNVEDYLSAADMFLFPSLYEGFPIALIEAQCSGLQCLVSNVVTKQAVFPELCEMLPLDCEIDSWVRAMKKNISYSRKEAVNLVRKHGLDVKSEILRLSNLYTEIIGNR